MKKLVKNLIFVLLLLFLENSCIEPYDPTIQTGKTKYLIVEGWINIGGASTFQLSFSRGLNEKKEVDVVPNAQMYIEAENNQRYNAEYSGNGTYTCNEIINDTKFRYRLNFSMNGKNYRSAFVDVKNAPLIDTIQWKATSAGVQLYVNAHDNENKTKYYKYDFVEDWKFHSIFFSEYQYKNGQVVFRSKDPSDPESSIFYCWGHDVSKSIMITNTLKLGNDLVSEFPFTLVGIKDLKLQDRYSILLKQYALTHEAYIYWESIQKNNESLGTLFDPMPDNIQGNIKNVNDDKELVMGFISAGSTSTKRIYINNTSLPNYGLSESLNCLEKKVSYKNQDWPYIFYDDYYIPTLEYKEIYPIADQGMMYAKKSCVDCRTLGTNIKPDFWKDF